MEVERDGGPGRIKGQGKKGEKEGDNRIGGGREREEQKERQTGQKDGQGSGRASGRQE